MRPIQHAPLYKEPAYGATTVDYRPESDDKVTGDRTLPHLSPFKEDTPLDARPHRLTSLRINARWPLKHPPPEP